MHIFYQNLRIFVRGLNTKTGPLHPEWSKLATKQLKSDPEKLVKKGEAFDVKPIYTSKDTDK